MIEFSPKINCFVGVNGVGKTNLLDAIHCLCIGKSYFNNSERLNLQHETPFFRLEGHFEKQNVQHQVAYTYERGKKKNVSLNENVIKKLVDFPGSFPVVMITPFDQELIYGGSEIRRKWLNHALCQLDKTYLSHLSVYNKCITQRNALLKQATKEKRAVNRDLLDVYDSKLEIPANYIFEKRKVFLDELMPFVEECYQGLVENVEISSLNYSSQLLEHDFAQLLKENKQKDIIVCRTSVGIHKDDVKFLINDFPAKSYGSQGQQKSFTLSLKLGLCTYFMEKLGIQPIILLDDIFDKLDENRIRNLLKFLIKSDFGQLFLTDAHLERLKNTLTELNISFKHFEVNKEEIITTEY